MDGSHLLACRSKKQWSVPYFLFGAALLGAGRFRLLVMRALLLLDVALFAAYLIGLVFRIAHLALFKLTQQVWAKHDTATVRFFTQREKRCLRQI